jgi:hypothetical protein
MDRSVSFLAMLARRRIAWLLGGPAASAVLLAGCGGGSGSANGPAGAPAPPPASQPQNFPSGAGKTLSELTAELPEGPVMFASTDLLQRGHNRVGFVFFDRARKQITGAETALYYASSRAGLVRGPFPAHSESLAVKPAFLSRTTAGDPATAKWVYVSDVPFRHDGDKVVVALARLDGRLVTSQLKTLRVGRHKWGPPEVGDMAIPIHTLTDAQARGDVSRIDTRVPPAPQLHEVDFAKVLGRKPVVLVFATPKLCRSRVCGPVVDIAAQLQAKYGKRVAFIHQEIYRDNEIAKGYRAQVVKWRLPNEPWTFVIDRHGRIAARFQSAFSAGELDTAIQQVLRR